MAGDGEEGDFPGLSLFELHGIAKHGGPKYDQISLTTLTTNNEQISLEEVGQNLNQIIWSEAYFESDFWRACKQELYSLFCTDDKRYSDLRKRIYSAGGKSETVIVSTIAATVAGTAGLMAGALVPFCAVCLLAVVKLGKEAFCRLAQVDQPRIFRDPQRD
jgi:hypothetical protein